MRSSCVMLAAIVWSACLAAPVGAQESAAEAATVKLSYRWPQQARVDVELRRTKVMEDGDSRDSLELSMVLRLALRPRDGGRELRLVRYETAVQGQSVGTPMEFAERDSAVTPRLVVDSLGTASNLLGIEAFASGLRRAAQDTRDSIARVAPALVPLFDAMTSETRITEVATTIWFEAVAFWVDAALGIGREFEMADTLQSLDPAQFAIPIQRSYVAVGHVACDEGSPAASCMQLAMLTRMDAANLRERLQSISNRSSRPATIDSASHEVISRVWTDPTTLVPRAFQRSEELIYHVQPPDAASQRNRQHTETALWVRITNLASALHAAAAAGDLDAVRAALAAGEPVDVPDDFGRTPLLVAVQLGREAVARRLVDAGANAQAAYGTARLHGDIDAMHWLQRNGKAVAIPVRALAEIAALADSSADATLIPPLADRVAADDADVDSRRALAKTLIAIYRDSLAERQARRLLARDACDATALHVLVYVQGYRFQRGEVPLDSSVVYANRQVQCAPTSGTAWSNVALISQAAGDSAAMQRAVEALAGIDYVTPGQRAAARWTLEAVPRDALLASDVALDNLTFRLLQRDGIRPDVRIVYANPAVALSVAQGRPVTAVPWIALDSTPWRSEGAYLELSAAPLGRTTRAIHWPSLQRMARVMRGPQVSDADRAFSQRPYDLRIPLALATMRYLGSVDVRPAHNPPAQLSDLDSASRLMLELAPWLDVTPAAGRESFAEVQGWIADAWLHHGRPWRGIPHLVDALESMPTNHNLWSSLAYHSLVSGDLIGADTAARRAVLMGESLSALLNLATLARLQGHADSALALLTRAGVKLDSLRAQPDSTWSWSLSHLPRSRADTVNVRPASSVHTHAARDAFFHHNRALALALRGEESGADLAVWKARALYDVPTFRCVIVSLSEATRAFAPVSDRARAWYLQFERSLRAGASCPAS